jgi:hypothetical protein
MKTLKPWKPRSTFLKDHTSLRFQSAVSCYKVVHIAQLIIRERQKKMGSPLTLYDAAVAFFLV